MSRAKAPSIRPPVFASSRKVASAPIGSSKTTVAAFYQERAADPEIAQYDEEGNMIYYKREGGKLVKTGTVIVVPEYRPPTHQEIAEMDQRRWEAMRVAGEKVSALRRQLFRAHREPQPDPKRLLELNEQVEHAEQEWMHARFSAIHIRTEKNLDIRSFQLDQTDEDRKYPHDVALWYSYSHPLQDQFVRTVKESDARAQQQDKGDARVAAVVNQGEPPILFGPTQETTEDRYRFLALDYPVEIIYEDTPYTSVLHAIATLLSRSLVSADKSNEIYAMGKDPVQMPTLPFRYEDFPVTDQKRAEMDMMDKFEKINADGVRRAAWEDQMQTLLYTLHVLKFQNYPELSRMLLLTDPSPLGLAIHDPWLGIGFTSDQSDAFHPRRWKTNWVGKKLMQIREEQKAAEVRKEQEEKKKRMAARTRSAAVQSSAVESSSSAAVDKETKKVVPRAAPPTFVPRSASKAAAEPEERKAEPKSAAAEAKAAEAKAAEPAKAKKSLPPPPMYKPSVRAEPKPATEEEKQAMIAEYDQLETERKRKEEEMAKKMIEKKQQQAAKEANEVRHMEQKPVLVTQLYGAAEEAKEPTDSMVHLKDTPAFLSLLRSFMKDAGANATWEGEWKELVEKGELLPTNEASIEWLKQKTAAQPPQENSAKDQRRKEQSAIGFYKFWKTLVESNPVTASNVDQTSRFYYLDIGCSDGYKTIQTAKQFGILQTSQIYGVDQKSFGQEKISTKYRKQFQFTEAKETDRGIPDAIKRKRVEFDLVSLFQTLHHTVDPIQILIDVTRVTRKGGYLLIREHDRDSDETDQLIRLEHLFYSQLENRVPYQDYMATKVERYFSKDALHQVLTALGWVKLGEEIKGGINPTHIYNVVYRLQ